MPRIIQGISLPRLVERQIHRWEIEQRAACLRPGDQPGSTERRCRCGCDSGSFGAEARNPAPRKPPLGRRTL